MASKTPSGSTTSRPVIDNEHISRLNDDVLLKIFTLNTELDFHNPHIPSWTVRHTSQVSARWRNLTLSSPLIWASSLDLADTTKWIKTVLYRTGNAPLDISYPSFSNFILSKQAILSESQHLDHELIKELMHERFGQQIDVNVDKLDVALSLFSRCRRFSLILRYDEEWRYAENKSISLNAPFLEEFFVVLGASVYVQGHTLRPPSESNIFDAAFQRNPNLKTLVLAGHGLKPPTFKPGTVFNLTTLTIKDLEENKSLEVEECLGILSCSPQIETLRLVNCFARKQDVDNLVTRPALFLSELRSLELKGVDLEVCLMFSLIEFSSSCVMDLAFHMVNNPQHSLVDKTMLLVQQRIQNFLAVQNIIDLSLFLHRYPGLGWKFWNNVHGTDEKNISVAWMPYYDTDTTPIFLCLKGILDAMSPNLRSLYLDTAKIDQREPLYHSGILRSLENVEFLCIPSTGTLKFIHMLFNDDHAASPYPPLFPKLQHIMIGYIYMTKKAGTQAHHIFDIRSKLGVPIPKCRIKDSGGPALEALGNDLAGLNVHLEWVGENQSPKGTNAKDEMIEMDKIRNDPQDVLGRFAIQGQWSELYKDDRDDLYDSDDLFGSDLDGEDEDSD